MDAISAALLIKSLDGLSARSAATAANIANANTSGYRPVRVTFEAALADAATDGAAAIGAIEPRFETAAVSDSLRLDLELATAATTVERYSALVELLNRELQLQTIAIKGSS